MLHTCLRWNASARAHVHTPLPYLANGWDDCVQVWCLATDLLDKSFTQDRGGMHLHVRMCTPPSHDGAYSPAHPSPIKASYWFSAWGTVFRFFVSEWFVANFDLCIHAYKSFLSINLETLFICCITEDALVPTNELPLPRMCARLLYSALGLGNSGGKRHPSINNIPLSFPKFKDSFPLC